MHIEKFVTDTRRKSQMSKERSMFLTYALMEHLSLAISGMNIALGIHSPQLAAAVPPSVSSYPQRQSSLRPGAQLVPPFL